MSASTRSGSIPEDKGRLVTAFLESFFKRYVEYDFTADLEEKLDLISDGKLDWKDVLRDFWRDFIARGRRDQGPARRRGARGAERAAWARTSSRAKADGGDPRACPNCGDRAPEPQDRQVRRLHRLLELSRMPLHPPARRQPTARRTRSTPDGKLLGTDPRPGSP